MLYKILGPHRQPIHGGAGQYPPPGEWTTPVSAPTMCTSGYHLTSDPLAWWAKHAELWLAEPQLPISGTRDDKGVFSSVRLTERITREWPLLGMFPRVRMFLAATARSQDPACNIDWADLSGADLSGADLSRADLSDANLSGANLSGADLSGANLSEADLSEANLSDANLSGANLSGANLSRADLGRANLGGANLSRAILSGANLGGANLSRAILSGANLSGADLSEANLSGADLSHVIGMPTIYKPAQVGISEQ